MSFEEEQALIEEVRTELLARLFHATDPDGVMAATENIRTSMETLVALGQGNKAISRDELTRLMVGLVKVSSGVAFLGQDALTGRVSAIERAGPSAQVYSCDADGKPSRVITGGTFFLHRGQQLEIVLSPRLTVRVGATDQFRVISGEIGQDGFDSELTTEGESHTLRVTLRQAALNGESYLRLPLITRPGNEDEATVELAFSARPVEVYPLRISWSVSRPVRR